jgi:imidazole glycerol-phosphate synthase subunit HisH
LIGVVDYGLGNVGAILNVYRSLDIRAFRASTPSELASATRIILPGVGSFDHAMTRLSESGMRTMLEEAVACGSVPLLGICVGMQMLAESSEEGVESGLGYVDGVVRQLAVRALPDKPHLPHLGWNSIEAISDSPLFRGLEEGDEFYFLHSYCFEPTSSRHVATLTIYGEAFASSVWRENIHGVQFHPEKSHSKGVRVLKNFAQI